MARGGAASGTYTAVGASPPSALDFWWSDPSTLVGPIDPAPSRIRHAGDQRALVSVRVKPPGQRWVVIGQEDRRGIVPESVTAAVDGSGPSEASFTLRDIPARSAPHLTPYSPMVMEVGGVPVWGGRLLEAPGRDGDSPSLNVRARGWQYHLDDDLLLRLWVHQRMADWVDVRSGFAAASADLAKFTTGWNVGVGDGAITMGWPKEVANPVAFTYPGVILDGGYTGAVKRVVAKITTLGAWTWGATLKISAADTLPVVPAVSDTYTLTGLTSGAISSTSFGATLTTPRRYVVIWIDQNATGTPSVEQSVRIESLLAAAATAFESGGGSLLRASDVVADVLASGALPLLRSGAISQSPLIDGGTKGIPHYTTEGYATPREVLTAMNTFHNWRIGVDLNRRLVFGARPSRPILEAGAWSGADFEDASNQSGEDLYNRVIVEATDPAGAGLAQSVSSASDVLTRQGFTRAGRYSVSAVLTAAAASYLGAAWLDDHATVSFKGSMSVSAVGGVRRAPGGTPLHPAHLLLYWGERIRMTNVADAPNGATARQAQISSVSYSHDDGQAVVQLDNERDRLQRLVAGLAAIQGVGA